MKSYSRKYIELIIEDYLNGMLLDQIYCKYKENLAQIVIYSEIVSDDIYAINNLNKRFQEIELKYNKNIPIQILCSKYGVDTIINYLIFNYLRTRKISEKDILICIRVKNREQDKQLEKLEEKIENQSLLFIFIFILFILICL